MSEEITKDNELKITFQEEKIFWSSRLYVPEYSANAIFSGDEKDLLVTFGYKIEEKGRGKRLVLSAHLYETDEYHSTQQRIKNKMKNLVKGRNCSSRQLKASDKSIIRDYEKTSDGLIDSTDSTKIAAALIQRNFSSDLSKAKFIGNDDKINKLIEIAQKRVVEAWPVYIKEKEQQQAQQSENEKIAKKRDWSHSIQ